MKKTGKRIRTLLTAALMTAMLSGCGGSGGSTDSMDSSQLMNDSSGVEINAEWDGAGGSYYDNDKSAQEVKPDSENDQVLNDRKLIKNVNLDVETKEFDALMAALEAQIQAMGGYIENMESYNGSSYSYDRNARYSNLTIRIPQNKLTSFLDTVSGICNVVRRSDSVDDVTLSYVDLESHRDALRTEQTRLLELLEKAESLEDILTIEDRLTTVRYQLESMESQLRTMDNKVNYSTVYLRISEVQELTPVVEETTWERISGGFLESLYDVGHGFLELFIWFIVNLPHLIVWAVIVTVVALVVRKAKKDKKAKKEAAIAAYNQRKNAENMPK